MMASLTRRGHRLQSSGWVAGLLILLVFPLVLSNPAITSIAVITLLFMTSATAWNGFSGYSGYISLGSGVFYGSGAYSVALLSEHLHLAAGYETFALVPLAGLIAAVVAIPVGAIALRTHRHTFVVITIAIFFVFQLFATNSSFTGGSSGLQLPTPLWTAATYDDRFYYAALAVLVVATVISARIRSSRFGLELMAIRDDEDRALGLGVRVFPIKLGGFVASAFSIGMAGALYAYFIGQIYPQFAFDPLFDITIALMAFLGGLGTLTGPLLGALILEPLQQYLTLQFSVGSVYLIIYGALFLLVILFMPHGIVPGLSTLRTRLKMRRAGATTAAEPQAVLTRLPIEAVRGGHVTMTGTHAAGAALSVKGITKAFGGLQALNGCELEVAPGSISGLIGPNGSGKTTLFNVITGYVTPDAGAVALGDRDITGFAPDQVFRLGIGRTFQLTRIFERLSVLDNMLIATRTSTTTGLRHLFGSATSPAAAAKATDMLELVGLARLSALEAGSLSYGQRKLLELAYVLVAEPSLVLLDEPAGGINLTLVNELAARVKTMNAQGTTFLIVEHNMEFVMSLCDRVTVLHQGRTIASGPPAEVRANPAVLDAYLGGADDEYEESSTVESSYGTR